MLNMYLYIFQEMELFEAILQVSEDKVKRLLLQGGDPILNAKDRVSD